MSPLLFVGWLAIAGDLPPEVRTPPAAPAQKEEGEIRVHCNGARTVCAVAHDDLVALVAANNLKADEITRLRDQLRTLSESKGCAKLEVVPKALPKLKRERDS